MLQLPLLDRRQKKQFGQYIRFGMRMAADQHVLQHCGVFEQFDVLEGSTDALGGNPVWRHTGEVFIVEDDSPGGWRIDQADHIKNGRFASPIRANDRIDLALLDLEADAVDRSQTAELLGEILDFEE